MSVIAVMLAVSVGINLLQTYCLVKREMDQEELKAELRHVRELLRRKEWGLS